MVGNRTHEQQLRVFQKQENTANAGKDFDPSIDLKKSDLERARERDSQNLQAPGEVQDENRSILRGVNQRSGHNKGNGS